MIDEETIQSALEWSSKITGLHWKKIEPPKALAGQNKILILTTEKGISAVLRISPATAPWARSGLYIKERLLKAGHAVPVEIAATKLMDTPFWASLQSVVPGEDLICCWQNLNQAQAASVATDVAHLVLDSVTIFKDLEPDGHFGRFAPPTGEKSNRSKDWPMFCQEWLDWAGGRALAVEQVDKKDMACLQEAIKRIEPVLRAASIKTFIFDAGARNVMIKNGQYAGLVDQDELMIGDPWVAPALALSELSICGAPWIEHYALSWAHAWNGNKTDMSKMYLYAALWNLQAAAKTGRILPDGRMETAIPSGLIQQLCLSV